MAATPFHTIYQALEYVKREFINAGGIPWTKPGTTNRTITHIEIILMPGRYAHNNGARGIDPVTGQAFGQEQFPVRLPDKVSLIGTSALNTVLDGEGVSGIIQMLPPSATANSHKSTKIKNIMFVNAGREGSGSSSVNGPAIFLGSAEEGGACHPTITNCLFRNNYIDIAVVNFPPLYSSVTGIFTFNYRHSPKIFNNTSIGSGTFVVNTCLFYSSGTTVKVAGGKPRIWNNVIKGGWPFYGVHPDDLKIDPSGLGGNYVEYNAYDPTMLNQNPVLAPTAPFYMLNSWDGAMRAMPVPGTPLPTVPTPPQPLLRYQPIVDMANYNNGLLFIKEVLDRSLGVQNNPSTHDFRLALWTTTNPSPAYPNAPNPLADIGINSFSPVQNNRWHFMGNGHFQWINQGGTWAWVWGPWNQMPSAWSSLPGYNPYTGLAMPDIVGSVNSPWDGEGYGNPRYYNHSGCIGDSVDLGFDEIGDLIMAGYHRETTIFNAGANSIPNGSSGYLTHPCSGSVYFFNIPGGTYQRPLANVEADTSNQFWGWIQKITTFTIENPLVYPNDNLTLGVNPSSRYTSTTTAPQYPYQTSPYPPFARYLFCDTSPSLLLDIHPLWGRTAQFNDPYASNSWNHGFHDPSAGLYQGPLIAGNLFDNPFHYHDPVNGITVQNDTPNPPGSYLQSSCGYLMGPSSNFILWLPSLPGYTVGNWGYGNIPSVDFIPWTNGFGVRYTCQLDPCDEDNDGLRGNNIQSFRTVFLTGGPGPSSSCKSSAFPKQKLRKTEDLLKVLEEAGVNINKINKYK